MSNRVPVQGDPQWARFADSVAGMFDPKAEAQGASLLATTRYNNARAAGVEDQNAALADTVLAAAGYTPQQIAGIRATRPSSYNDISQGVMRDAGVVATNAGDYRKGLVFTGQANALDNLTKSDISMAAVTDPASGKIDPVLAGMYGIKPENLGGESYQFDPTQRKWVSIGVNPQGQSYLAGGQAKTDVAGATVNKINTQATAIQNLSESQIADRARLTDAQIEDLVNQGANRDALRLARTQAIEHMNGLATEKNNALIENIKAKTAGFNAESAARIQRTNSLIDLDKIKGQVALLGDPIKKAQAQATLYSAIENHYARDFSENLGNNQWEKVDPLQKKSLSDRALEYMRRGDDFGLALAKSEKDHGLTGKMVKGLKTNIFGLRPRPDGTITFDGFKAPDALAEVVAAGSAPGGTPPAPAITPPAVTPPAAGAAPAPAAAPAAGTVENPVRVTTKEERDALAPGTVYVAPDGVVRTKS